jgi:hypothetical protein
MPRVMGSGYCVSCAETEERRERTDPVRTRVVLKLNMVDWWLVVEPVGRGWLVFAVEEKDADWCWR